MKRVLLVALAAMLFASFEVHGQRANRRQTQSRPQNLVRYAGKYPRDLFIGVPSIKPRLRTLLGRNFNYQIFLENLRVQVPIEQTQNYLKVSGAAPQGFGTEEAVLFISLSNGRLHCGILSNLFGGQWQVFSEDPENMPSELQSGDSAAATSLPLRIQFPRGRTSVVLRGTVIANQEALYDLRAKKGQNMSVRLDSRSDSIRFTLYAVRGEMLAQDAMNWQGELPETNDYVIVVTTTERRSNFTLEVSIK